MFSILQILRRVFGIAHKVVEVVINFLTFSRFASFLGRFGSLGHLRSRSHLTFGVGHEIAENGLKVYGRASYVYALS